MAPAAPSPICNTTLPAGADFYVANRGNGTIARLQQDGAVVAVRRLQVDGLGLIGPGWVNGIGLSTDGAALYVTLTGPIEVGDRVWRGLLISIPAF
jgi:sugar lactone lactonase YvrE